MFLHDYPLWKVILYEAFHMAQAVIGALAVLVVHANDLVGRFGDVQHDRCEVIVATGVGVDTDHVGAADGATLTPVASGGAAHQFRWEHLGVGRAERQLVLGVPCGLGHPARFAGLPGPLGVVAVDRVL